jgi:pyruvate,orthophosphate dikinase
MSQVQAYLFEEAGRLGLTKFELGGKGYGLVEMTKIGLPVPPGIVITTEMCRRYFQEGKKLPNGLRELIAKKLKTIEERTGKRFGDPTNPLLVSVRSGAPYSMPGMMDTILNLGVNDEVVKGLHKISGDERFAYDTYRRFIQLYGKIVMKVAGEKFEKIIEDVKREFNAKSDIDVPADGWKKVVKLYKELIRNETGKDLPQDPYEQLFSAIAAVFESWWNPRAVEYRRIYRIPDNLCTAVNIVTMVYGNLDDKSATGVAFTRNPSTGEKELYGEYLLKAQGEDVVAGIRTPRPVRELKGVMPKVYEELEEAAEKLERYFKDMQDIEFTIERGKLYILQTRTGKRTATAAVKIAVDMVEEGLITKEDAVARIDPAQLEKLLHKQIDPQFKGRPIAKGLPASPGAAVGRVVFKVEDAVEAKRVGEKVILVRPETTPEDISGIFAAEGVLTSRGGMTSHAAVVTRGLGKPCVVGAESVKVDLEQEFFEANGIRVEKGDLITIDGSTGSVYEGEVPLVEPKISGTIDKLLNWADEIRLLGVRANADTPQAATKARSYGAQGIGLARTERMFNAEDRLAIVQSMILAETLEERKKHLERLKPFQKNDFKEIFRVMKGLPVTVRLLDLPLHEFLPKLEELLPEVIELRLKGGEGLEKKERILRRVLELKEHNPMMGQRGVRLAMTHPEIYEMQVSAIVEAAIEVLKEEGETVELEIMIPQLSEAEELRRARELVERVASQVMERMGVKIGYKVGTMIETPRAALTASRVAKYADFFSFGTNDLTQATFAFSRDDVEAKFIPFYVENRILSDNPFETLDTEAVGRLVKTAVQEGRASNPDLRVGICGEHGGEPRSISFFYEAGLDYVSCSPFRVPIARLAAAQATLKRHETRSTV